MTKKEQDKMEKILSKDKVERVSKEEKVYQAISLLD